MGRIERTKAKSRRAPSSAEPRRDAAPSSGSAPLESLREQADRLGLLDPLEAEPANVFAAAVAAGPEKRGGRR